MKKKLLLLLGAGLFLGFAAACATQIVPSSQNPSIVPASSQPAPSQSSQKGESSEAPKSSEEGSSVKPESSEKKSSEEKSSAEKSSEEKSSQEKSSEPGPHVHEIEPVSGQAKTCDADGWKDYFKCKSCEKFFKDAEGKNEITDLAAWKTGEGKIPASHGTMTHKDGKASDCHNDGWKEYYQCEDCKKYYEEASATTLIANLETWKTGEGKISAAHGTMIKTNAVDATCHSIGVKEYYQCNVCKEYYEDAQASTLIGDADALASWKENGGKIPMTDHHLVDSYSKESNIWYINNSCDNSGCGYVVKTVLGEEKAFDVVFPLITEGTTEKGIVKGVVASVVANDDGSYTINIKASFTSEDVIVLYKVKLSGEKIPEVGGTVVVYGQFNFYKPSWATTGTKQIIEGIVLETVAPAKYVIELEKGIHVKSCSLQDGQEVALGSEIIFTVTADDNYGIYKVFLNNEELAGFNGKYTFIATEVNEIEIITTTKNNISTTQGYCIASSQDQIVENAKMVLVATVSNEGTTTYKAMAELSDSEKYRNAIDATVNDGILTLDDDMEILTLEKAEGGFYLKTEDGKYLCASGIDSDKNELSTVDDKTTKGCIFLITYNPGGKLEVKAIEKTETGVVRRNVIRYNSSSPRFCCYTSGQSDVFGFVLSDIVTTKSCLFDDDAYHSLISHPAVAHTCDTDGYEAYWECEYCECLFSDAEGLHEIDAPVVDPKGHNFGEKVDAKASTCTVQGNVEHYYCDACEKYYAADKTNVLDYPSEVLLPLAEHSWKPHTDVAATTESDGSGHYECEVCQAEGEHYVIPKITCAHPNLESFAKQDATCKETGTKAYWHCPDCGKYFADAECTIQITEDIATWKVIPLAEHKYGDFHDAVLATCTEDGTLGHYQCSVCDKYFDVNHEELSSIVDPKKGHDKEHIDGLASTCCDEGYLEAWHCQREGCDLYYSDEACTKEIGNEEAYYAWILTGNGVIAKKAHTFDSETIHPASDATCEKAGNVAYWYCTTCEKYYDADFEELDTIVLPKLDHNYETSYIKENNTWYKDDHCTVGDEHIMDPLGEEIAAKDAYDAIMARETTEKSEEGYVVTGVVKSVTMSGTSCLAEIYSSSDPDKILTLYYIPLGNGYTEIHEFDTIVVYGRYQKYESGTKTIPEIVKDGLIMSVISPSAEYTLNLGKHITSADSNIPSDNAQLRTEYTIKNIVAEEGYTLYGVYLNGEAIKPVEGEYKIQFEQVNNSLEILATGINNYSKKTVYSETTFVKATSIEDIAAAGKVLFAYTNDNSTVVMGAQNTNNFGQVTATVTDGKITLPIGASVVEVIKVEGGYNLKYNGNFLTSATGNNNHLKNATGSSPILWKITLKDGVFSFGIEMSSDVTRYIKYNESSTIFSAYKSGQKNVLVYIPEGSVQDVLDNCVHGTFHHTLNESKISWVEVEGVMYASYNDECDLCDHDIVLEATAATVTDELAPTCLTTGYKDYEITTEYGKYTHHVDLPALNHNWSNEWSKDDTNHWHACLNEGCSEIKDQATHNYGDWILDLAPTCTTTGKEHHVCQTCGYSEEHIIDALQHNWDTEWDSDATNHWHNCLRDGCDATTGTAAHTFGGWTEDEPATCLKPGSRHRICSICGYRQDESILATGHNMEFHAKVEPTCVDEGTVAYYHCSNCDKNFSDEEGLTTPLESLVIAPKGHTWGEPTYSWNGDQCTAERHCTVLNCTGVETETVTGTYVKDTDAKCESNEFGHYNAKFTNIAFAEQNTAANSVEVEDTALGHLYGEASYSWNENECTASHTCTREGCNHEENEKVTGTYVKDTDALCEVNEFGHYNAKFDNEAFAEQNTATNSVEKPDSALGHIYNYNKDTGEGEGANHKHTVDCDRPGCTTVFELEACTFVATSGDGTITYKCSKCDYEYKVDVPHQADKDNGIIWKDSKWQHEYVCNGNHGEGDDHKDDVFWYVDVDTSLVLASIQKGEVLHGYLSLQDAFDAAEDGNTIKLLNNIDLGNDSVKLKKEIAITLDLNGHNITSKCGNYTIDISPVPGYGKGQPFDGKLTLVNSDSDNAATITNTSDTSSAIRTYGELVVNGNIIITRGLEATISNNSAIKVEEGAKLTIEDGHIIGFNRSIQSFGTTVINGGTFDKSVEAHHWGSYVSSLTINGGTFGGAIVKASSMTLTDSIVIKGGTFANDPSAFVPSEGYVVRKVDSKFVVEAHASHTWNYSAATFNWNGFECETATVPCSDPDCKKTLTVETTVSSEVTTQPSCTETGIRTYTAKFVIESVEYKDTKTDVEPATGHHKDVLVGYYKVEGNWKEKWHCNKDNVDFYCDLEAGKVIVAQVGDEGYLSLADAVKDAPKDNTETTITLLAPAEGTTINGSGIITEAGQNIIIDLNGLTYVVTEPLVGSTGTETLGFQFLKGSIVTLKNGEVAVNNDGCKMLFQNYANLTLKDIIADMSENPNVNYVSSNNCGELNLINSKLIAAEGKVALDAWYGMSEVYLDGVTVTVDDKSVIKGIVEYGSAVEGDWASKCVIDLSSITLANLENATFKTSGSKVSNIKDANIGLPEGYTFNKEGKIAKIVAVSTDLEEKSVNYASLAEAVEAVPTDGKLVTIKLYEQDKTVNGSGIVTNPGQKVKIDFNGCTYVVTEPLVGSTGTVTLGFQFLKGSEVELYNGTIDVNNDGCKMLFQNYAKLTLDSIVADMSEHANVGYVSSNNCGELYLINSTLIAAEGKVALDAWYGMSADYLSGISIIVDEDSVIKGIIEYGSAVEGDWYNKSVIDLSDITLANFADVTFKTSGSKVSNIKDANIDLPVGYTFNKEGKIAKIVAVATDLEEKSVNYASLAEAVEATNTDGELVTIKLYEQDKTVNGSGIVTNPGQNIVIDLNGCTYVVTEPLVGSTGTVTLGFQFLKGSKVTLKNGEVAVNNDGCKMLFQNYANLTLDNIIADMSENTNVTYVSSNNCGSLTLIKSWLIAAEGKVALDAWYGMDPIYYGGVTITIDDESIIEGFIEYGSKVSDGWHDVTIMNLANIDVSNFDNATFKISGSHVSGLDAANIILPSNYMLNAEGKIVLCPVALYRSTELVGYYKTLEAAVAAAEAGDKVVLTKELSSANTVTINKNITLDLANKYTFTGTGYAFVISGDCTVTIDGTLDSSDKGIQIIGANVTISDTANITSVNRALGIYDGATVAINGNLLSNSADEPTVLFYDRLGDAESKITLTITGNIQNKLGAALQGNGNDTHNNSVTVNGADIISGVETETIDVYEGGDIAIYWPCNGTLTVKDSNVIGATGIYVKGGSLVLDNSYIEGYGDKLPYVYSANGAYSTGNALVIDSCSYPSEIGTLSILDGTVFWSENTCGIASYCNAPGVRLTHFVGISKNGDTGIAIHEHEAAVSDIYKVNNEVHNCFLYYMTSIDNAYDIADKLEHKATTTVKYTVKGIVTNVYESYGKTCFDFLTTDGNVLEVFQFVLGENVVSPVVGDIAVVNGYLTKYNSTCEFAAGCELVAVYHNNYTVAYNYDDSRVNLNGAPTSVSSGGTNTFTIAPTAKEGFEIASVKVGTKVYVAVEGVYTIEIGYENIQVDIVANKQGTGPVYDKTTYTDTWNKANFGNRSTYGNATYNNSAKGISYAAYLTSNGSNMQLKGSSNSGIVTLTVPANTYVKSVTVNATTDSSQVDVYAKNTAYSGTSDLYGSDAEKGTLIGSVANSGTINFSGDYKYVALRANKNAIYLSSVVITYEYRLNTLEATLGEIPTFADSYTANTNINLPQAGIAYDYVGLSYSVTNGGEVVKYNESTKALDIVVPNEGDVAATLTATASVQDEISDKTKDFAINVKAYKTQANEILDALGTPFASVYNENTDVDLSDTVSWSVVDGDSASINGSKLEIRVGATDDHCIIRATKTFNGIDYTKDFEFDVLTPKNPTSISVSAAGGASQILRNETLQLSATVDPAAASQAVTWSIVSGSEYATINDEGLLTGVAVGTVTVRATSAVEGYSSIYGEYTVTLNPVLATGISLDKTTATMLTTDELTLVATVTPTDYDGTVTWTSSDETVATVAGGVITPIKGGTTTITASINGHEAICVLTIVDGSVQTSVGINYSKLYSSDTKLTSNTLDGNIDITYNANGGTDPKYYTSGSAARIYNKNKITFAGSNGALIKQINFTFTTSNSLTPNVGAFDGNSWKGLSSNVVFSCSDTTRISSIEVIYVGGIQPTKYNVSVVEGITGGSVTANPNGSVVEGTTIELSNSPLGGYALDYYKVNGVEIQGSSFVLSADSVVSAVFKTVSSYTVSTATCTNGSITLSHTGSVSEGTEVTITPTPDTGYVVDKVYYNIGGDDVEITAVNDVYKHVVTASTTFKAKFKAETKKTYTLELTPSDFSTSSYDANDGDHKKTASCTGGTMDVTYNTSRIMQSSSNIQFKKSEGYLYNKTDLGTIKSVTISSSAGSFTTFYGKSEHPTSGTTVGNGYFTIKIGNATGKVSSIVIVFEK